MQDPVQSCALARPVLVLLDPIPLKEGCVIKKMLLAAGLAAMGLFIAVPTASAWVLADAHPYDHLIAP